MMFKEYSRSVPDCLPVVGITLFYCAKDFLQNRQRIEKKCIEVLEVEVVVMVV